jgi:hypothetical protein
MRWRIEPPSGASEKDAQKTCKLISTCLRHPTWEIGQNTYSSYLSAVVRDLLTLNFAAIQRMDGKRGGREGFTLRCIDAARISYDPTWVPNDGDRRPRYFYRDNTGNNLPILDSELFIIQRETSSYRLIPPSPVEIAFPFVLSFLALHGFQKETTGEAKAEFILDIGDVSRNELEAFRDYWKESVEGRGATPIVAGKGQLQSIKLGATSDSGLYLTYTEFLLRMIAQSFDLTPRDLGKEDYTYATAGVSAMAAFQEAILPIAQCLTNFENEEAIDFYFPGYRKELNDYEPRDEGAEAQTHVMLFEANVATLNEIRQKLGFDRLEKRGDVFANGSTLEDASPPQPQGSPPATPPTPSPSANPTSGKRPPQGFAKTPNAKPPPLDRAIEKVKSQKQK